MPTTKKHLSDIRLNNAGLLIYQAANSGDVKKLELVFSKVPQNDVAKAINFRDSNGMTPLTVSAKKGSLGCVKLLLYHGADINHSIRQKLQTHKVWHFARKAGHFHVEQYLRKCHRDLMKLNTTRALLELTVLNIATNPHCTLAERERFDVCLRQLIKYCDYDLYNSDDSMGDAQPLIIKAARVDNIPIVLKLLKDYEVTVETHDVKTAESLMHIACQNVSKLRFYLVHHHPALLRKRDINGTLPLHIACKHNDVEFISWLFQNILAVEDRDGQDQFELNGPVKKARSFSDLTSPQSLSNRSFQSVFPMSPVDLTSPPASFLSVYSPRGSVDEYNGEADTITPLFDHLREHQGLNLSYDSSRSLTISVCGSSSGSRSGSCEPPSRRRSKSGGRTPCSVSSDEAVFFESQISNNEETGSVSSKPTSPQVIVSSSAEENDNDTERPNDWTSSVEPELDLLLDRGTLISPHQLSIKDIVDTKPFSVDVQGDSLFHILAREGNAETLGIVVKVAAFLKHQVDLSILTNREGFSSRLAIEEAIYIRNTECVRLLIHLALVVGQMPTLLQDPHVLRVAVITNDIKLVRILIENGFHTGLKSAISMAIVSDYDDILRFLLFWQAQVVNSMQVSRLKEVGGQRVRRLDAGAVKWEEIQLVKVQPQWLEDSASAVTSVSKLLSLSHITADITEHDFEYFKMLGRDCLEYFENLRPLAWSSDLKISLVPITELNISENQLSSVPLEIFQMPSLRTLLLSHNKITELPTSCDFYQDVYTSGLTRLVLDSNQLTGIPEDLCRGLACSLKDLSVEYNQLQSLPPGLWVMPKLRRIKLAHNKLERLHYFSFPRYFIDEQLSKMVTSWFTVSNLGGLICSSPASDSREVRHCADYLEKLAMFYHTVCVARLPKGACKLSDIYQEMINIHLARYTNFTNSSSSDRQNESNLDCTIPNSAQILRLFEEDEFGPTSECTMEIEHLDLSHNSFREFPWDLACISPDLQKLDIRCNMIQQLDLVHSVPRNISSFIAMWNRIAVLKKQRSMNLPCANPLRLLCVQDDLISETFCQHCNHSMLANLSNLILDNNKISHFPIIDTPRSESQPLGSDNAGFEFVYCDPYYPEVSILSLAHNQFREVPKHLDRLTHLSSLTLSNNAITQLPLEMGLMNSANLLVLKLDNLYLRNIPDMLRENHTPKSLLNYLKSLQQKSRPYRRMKLMMVGAANRGKTSLLLNLVKKGKMKRFTEVERGFNDVPLSTVGVELGDWEYSHGVGKPKVTFMTWDFGGQEEYYATHQCFLTRRSLYLLLWNVMDGEEGLRNLKPWMENIEGRAPKSPVVVIGTHVDQLNQAKKHEILCELQATFVRMFIQDSHRKYTYPSIHHQCHFINVNSSRHVEMLREFLYDFAIQYKVPSPCSSGDDVKPLLDEPVPESYIVLQDFVRETAEAYVTNKLKPILTKKQYIQAIKDSDYADKIKETDIDQATSFLHDSGILLHYEDSSLLSDLYFINPQWLCSMLAKLITIKEQNPFQRQGFMIMDDVKKIYTDCLKEFITLMQKFEVVLLLDEQRLLIPSLLPTQEEEACLVFSSSCYSNGDNIIQMEDQPHAPMYETPHPIMSRFYLLPFVPNGFFSRLMARLMSMDIVDHLQHSLISNTTSMDHIINSTHWKCWRTGILVTWSHMEIFRIAPLTRTPAGASKVAVVTKRGESVDVGVLGGLEIKVAMLPEEYIECSTLQGQLSYSASATETSAEKPDVSRGRCLATWLLHKATTAIDSVFEDWYESFARKKGFDPHQENVRITNPCNKCMEHVQKSQLRESRMPNMVKSPPGVGVAGGGNDVISKPVCYVFTSMYAAHVAASCDKTLECPTHGTLNVADVAPDLVFCDFLPSTVFPERSSLVIRQRLGDGGFGTVYRATLHIRGTVETLAVKQFTPDMGFLEQDPDILEQLKAWDIYQKASLEARVMHQLCHPNILGLVGVALQPLSLLVELAPEGDLKKCVERFKREKVRLSRRTLRITLIQVAEALNYLHSHQFIYRDLKPENVLVWKFPRPENRWSTDSPIYVKVADYGISKQITPQGIRGMEGTRPYLPPEVILHGGREAYSTKLDVYAFGMFIYYLVSFRTPFDTGRPITALLEEGKRPELLPKHRPHSHWLFELMCWCWSERSNHRPDFTKILHVLKSDTFTHLLASFPVLGEEEVTGSCIRLCRQRRRSVTSTLGYSTMVDQSLSSLGVMSLLNSKSSYTGEEFATQVWYGTENGKFGMIQFNNSGATHEQIELPVQKKFVSAVQLISGRVWVSTVGSGIFIYNPNTRDFPLQWMVTERYRVYTFMEVEEVGKVVAFTNKGFFVFSSSLDISPEESTLKPLLERENDEDLSIGVVVSPWLSGKVQTSEIWATSLSGPSMFILNTTRFTLEKEVPQPDTVKRRLTRHMKMLNVADTPLLAVTDKHLINFFDVMERKCLPKQFDCVEICSRTMDISNGVGRVSSLTAKDHFLYAAVKGCILCLNCETMEPARVFDAYWSKVRSLIVISYSETHSRHFQRFLSHSGDTLASSYSLGSPNQRSEGFRTFGSSSSVSSLRSTPRSQSSLDAAAGDEMRHSVLISFGVGYKGVVGDHSEHPESFILPSDGSRNNYQPAKPDRSTGCLLLWSTEEASKSRKDPDQCLSAGIPEVGIPEADETEELSMPDDVATAYP